MESVTIKLTKDLVIEKENLEILGKAFAIRAANCTMDYEYKRLYSYYRNLISDISKPKSLTECYSDSYELVQEASCFLCKYVGRKFGDTCEDSKKRQTIMKECFCHLYSILRFEAKKIDREYPIVYFGKNKPKMLIDTDLEIEPQDYSKVNELIKKMNLTDIELQVLKYKFNNVTNDNVAEFVNRSTRNILVIRNRIRAKVIGLIDKK